MMPEESWAIETDDFDAGTMSLIWPVVTLSC
jgi:hypothetical protein